MRRVRYQVACSLDGYIAGPGGESDWIVMDPEIDFEALYREFDTLVMERRTFEALAKQGGSWSGMQTGVFPDAASVRSPGGQGGDPGAVGWWCSVPAATGRSALAGAYRAASVQGQRRRAAGVCGSARVEVPIVRSSGIP